MSGKRGICSVDGCGKAVQGRGWCGMHYYRWRTHGDLTTCTTNRYVPEVERFWMKVQKGPGCWEWRGAIGDGAYGTFTTGHKGKTYKAHRYAYESLVGPVPPGKVLDHRCHNLICVNPSHLRPVTKKQNGEHRKGARRDSTTGVLGVSKTRYGTYSYKVTHHGQQYGGTRKTLEEAAEAVRQLRLSLYTHNDMDRRAA